MRGRPWRLERGRRAADRGQAGRGAAEPAFPPERPKRGRLRRVSFARAVRAGGFALALCLATSAAHAADKVALQLDGPVQFQFAGYYAALWNGFYRKAGLDVAIRPGAGPGATPIDPVREVTEGRAQFGTGTVRLAIRAAQGLPLLLLAPIFQASGATVYYRADGDFAAPGALLNGRIGRLPASNILDIELRTALIAEGIDPDRLRSIPVAPGKQVDELAEHRVDAVIGSAWTVPWQARQRGLALKSFDPAAYRVQFYGDSLFTLRPYAQEHPDLVRRFRAASLQGWDYALLHPSEIATRMAAERPHALSGADPQGFIRYQSAVARRLALAPGIPIGHSNRARWRRIVQSFRHADALARPVDLDAFLYQARATPRGAGERQTWAALFGAVAIAILLIAGGFSWHRRRRSALGDGLAFAGSGANRALVEAATGIADELAAVADRIAAALEEIRRQAVVQPRLGRFCATALEALDALRAITRRLTMLPGAPSAQPTDLNAALTAIERAIRQELPVGVAFRLSLAPEAWLCAADADAVAGAVLDLVAIAADETPADGEVVVGTRNMTIDRTGAAETPGGAPGEYLRLTVRNSGPGLPPESLNRIFDARATVRPAIAAAWQLTRVLGGFARVETAEGVGTAVHLFFRRSAPAATTAAPPAAPVPAPTSTPSSEPNPAPGAKPASKAPSPNPSPDAKEKAAE